MKTFIALFLIPAYLFCQSDKHIVVQVSNEICLQLNEVENIDSLTAVDVKTIIAMVFLDHKEEWNNQLDEIDNSRNNSQNIFNPLLNHRLLLDCENYRKVDRQIDNSFKNNPAVKELYQIAKDFIIMAELGANEEFLFSNVDMSKRKDSTLINFKSLQKEAVKFTKNTSLHFVWSENSNGGSVFVINNYSYKTGEPNYYLKILFENDNDQLIDGLVFVDKNKIEEERKNREEINLESIPPPPPIKNKN